MNVKILNEKSIPNLPWQDRPADCQDVIWRYKANPIIKRNILPTSNSVFNSAVVPFEGGFAGVFRVDDPSTPEGRDSYAGLMGEMNRMTPQQRAAIDAYYMPRNREFLSKNLTVK